MMTFLASARKYRPQTFQEVLGQNPTVTTLKNAIKNKQVAGAYLFCGFKGTGKTTLARVFAKALNCIDSKENSEPCNQCASCKEITSGNSLDVLEIDGASNRGIEDVRQINETVNYAPAYGKYKIYIIDEVHMLTKEAFNALLKTLEEPPVTVKFLFATTEPHKVPSTILSRCQRFNLKRVTPDLIIQKLEHIASDRELTADGEALRIITQRAEGSLRDAESLFDQIHSFHDGNLTSDVVISALGMVTKDLFFQLDQAGKEGNLAFAFEITQRIFSEGKDLFAFVDDLVIHFRHLIIIKLSGTPVPHLNLSDEDLKCYNESVQLYSQPQLLTILEVIIKAQQEMRFASSPRIAVEALLLRILRSHHQIPIEMLVQRLDQLEKKTPPLITQKTQPTAPLKKTFPTTESVSQSKPEHPPSLVTHKTQPAAPLEKTLPPTEKKSQSEYDTLFQFAAVELDGTMK